MGNLYINLSYSVQKRPHNTIYLVSLLIKHTRVNKMSKENYLKSAAFGSLSALNAYASLSQLLEYASTRSAIIQTELARAPEFSQQIYETASNLAEKISTGDLVIGGLNALVSGLTFGIAVYFASKDN